MAKEFSLKVLSSSAQRTKKAGKDLGKLLPPGAVVALEGDLGSGKTLFVKGLAEGLKIEKPGEVRSPTFALIQEHQGPIPLCHADLYRLGAPEIRNLGLEEYWRRSWVTAIEWADRAAGLLPGGPGLESPLSVRFQILSPNKREIVFAGNSDWEKILRKWERIFLEKS